MKILKYLILLQILFVSVCCAETVTNEQKTIQHFNAIKNDPEQLYIFLNQMPKGSDLHNHLSGATYAEDLLAYAKQDNFCIDPKTFMLSENPSCPAAQQLVNVPLESDFYRNIIQNWSLEDFVPGQESSEEHFFPAFIKFGPIVSAHFSEVLSEVVSRSGAEKTNYLELLLTPYDLNLIGNSGDRIAELGKKIGWNNDFSTIREQLLRNGLLNFVQQITPKINTAENAMRKRLKCGTSDADPGCQVTVRYQYIALRELPPEQVFAQLLAGFEIAKRDPRFVAVNLVQAEDGPIAERDYNLHMQMINYLHKLYPQVHVSLHAGELAPGSVPPENMRNHIRNAVEITGAERIGHGVDIAYEDNAQQLMQEMVKKNVLVEICLTSNAKLLDVKDKDHPFSLYLRNRVPVALATDDEGVLRTDITREFQRAVLTYNLDYLTLKKLARNSIAYSFLRADEKAKMLKELDRQFDLFEKNIIEQ